MPGVDGTRREPRRLPLPLRALPVPFVLYLPLGPTERRIFLRPFSWHALPLWSCPSGSARCSVHLPQVPKR